MRNLGWRPGLLIGDSSKFLINEELDDQQLFEIENREKERERQTRGLHKYTYIYIYKLIFIEYIQDLFFERRDEIGYKILKNLGRRPGLLIGDSSKFLLNEELDDEQLFEIENRGKERERQTRILHR